MAQANMDLLNNLKDKLIDKDGKKFNGLLDGQNEFIGLYFSGHWCPPCRGFTPVLKEYYDANHEKDKIEIIFISSDRDEEGFKGYFATMPWKALDFAARKEKEEIGSKFGVQSIPTFIVLDNKGNVVDRSGRNKVSGVNRINWGKSVEQNQMS